MKKILIIRLSSIGDIVLTTPLLRAIKNQRPDLELHYLTKSSYAPVLQNNPNIDKLFLFQKDCKEVIKDLKHEDYDYIIDLHKNLRSFRIKKALKTPSCSFEKLNWEKWLLVQFKINNLPNTSIVQRYFDTLKELKVKNDGLGLEYYSGLESQENIKGLDPEIAKSFAVLVIGGTYFTKQIPIAKSLEIIENIRIPVLLLGGPDDQATAAELVKKSNKKIGSAVGISSINESAEIIRRSEFVVSGDTGLMHIAAAYQKKIFSLWGNTVPEFGMSAYMPQHPERSIIIENKTLNCRPCSKLGYQKCPKKHFDCMNSLDVSVIK